MESPSASGLPTAERESERALRAVFDALDMNRSFLLEAGAGAGKTYSLIAALRRILQHPERYLPRSDQSVACLTYTKVARDEIVRRTDGDPRVVAETIHGFLWQMIAPHQRVLAQLILASDKWLEVLDGRTSLAGLTIEYSIGIRGISDSSVRLHHDDVPELARELLRMPKFRSLLVDRFPIFFIDEYQDTPDGLVEAMLGDEADTTRPLIGFFGDHWQQIYEKSSRQVDHPTVTVIPKNANFRSATSIVTFLNGLRPELLQTPAAGAVEGSVRIYHANSWPGTRLTHSWKGDISHRAAREVLRVVAEDTRQNAWPEASGVTKTLMLTHTALANELGYGSLPGVFKHNDAFAKKEDEVIAYLLDVIEPASEAFVSKRFGILFDILGGSKPHIRSRDDKLAWTTFFEALEIQRLSGNVGTVLDLVLNQELFSVPGRVTKRQRDLDDANRLGEAGDNSSTPRRTSEYRDLRNVKYEEITALGKYVDDKTIFSTKHNVKGAEFDNVIVVLGRGWTAYDFAKMVSLHSRRDQLSARDRASYEKSRNLFYVAVSRAKRNLALVFTQVLDADALTALSNWAGPDNIVDLQFLDENTPQAPNVAPL